MVQSMVACPQALEQAIMAAGVMVEEVLHLMVDRRQRERKGLRTRYNLQRYVPSDLLPLTRPTS
jgi:hypothetical protein